MEVLGETVDALWLEPPWGVPVQTDAGCDRLPAGSVRRQIRRPPA